MSSPSLFVVLLSGFTATALPLDDNFKIANGGTVKDFKDRANFNEFLQQEFEHFPFAGGEIAILVRKKVGNPVDFFDKTFDEYEEGFSAKGLLKQKSIQIYKRKPFFQERAGLALTRSTD